MTLDEPEVLVGAGMVSRPQGRHLSGARQRFRGDGGGPPALRFTGAAVRGVACALEGSGETKSLAAIRARSRVRCEAGPAAKIPAEACSTPTERPTLRGNPH